MIDTQTTPETTTQAPQTPEFGAANTASATPTERKPQYPPKYTIYKPNGRGSGGAVEITLAWDRSCAFARAANQCGERQFDWENKIIMKWAVSDLGAILAVLQARQPEAKLFHRTERADTTLNFLRQDAPDRAPYLLAINRQDAADKSLRKVAIPVTHAEAAVLETVVRASIARILKW